MKTTLTQKIASLLIPCASACGDISIVQECRPEGYAHRGDYVADSSQKEDLTQTTSASIILFEQVIEIYKKGTSTSWKASFDDSYEVSPSLIRNREQYQTITPPFIKENTFAQCGQKEDRGLCIIGTFQEKNGIYKVIGQSEQAGWRYRQDLESKQTWANKNPSGGSMLLSDNPANACSTFWTKNGEKSWGENCNRTPCLDHYNEMQNRVKSTIDIVRLYQ